jgi:hypothetical protein
MREAVSPGELCEPPCEPWYDPAQCRNTISTIGLQLNFAYTVGRIIRRFN